MARTTWIGKFSDNVTLTANATSNVLILDEAEQIMILLDAPGGTGTSPTLDITIQVSPDGTTWFDLPSSMIDGGAFTQVTTTPSKQVRRINTNVGSRMRLSYTVGGTLPSFAGLTAHAIAKG